MAVDWTRLVAVAELLIRPVLCIDGHHTNAVCRDGRVDATQDPIVRCFDWHDDIVGVHIFHHEVLFHVGGNAGYARLLLCIRGVCFYRHSCVGANIAGDAWQELRVDSAIDGGSVDKMTMAFCSGMMYSFGNMF